MEPTLPLLTPDAREAARRPPRRVGALPRKVFGSGENQPPVVHPGAGPGGLVVTHGRTSPWRPARLLRKVRANLHRKVPSSRGPPYESSPSGADGREGG